MKRRLAVNRWRLLLALVCTVILRVVAAVGVHVVATEFATEGKSWIVVATVWDIGLCLLGILTVASFVQYGRIFNPRVPTE